MTDLQEEGVGRAPAELLLFLPLNAPLHVPPLPAGGSALSAGCASGHERLQRQRNSTDSLAGKGG